MARAAYFFNVADASAGPVFFDRGIVDAVTALERLGEVPAACAAAARRYRYGRKVFLVPPWRSSLPGMRSGGTVSVRRWRSTRRWWRATGGTATRWWWCRRRRGGARGLRRGGGRGLRAAFSGVHKPCTTHAQGMHGKIGTAAAASAARSETAAPGAWEIAFDKTAAADGCTRRASLPARPRPPALRAAARPRGAAKAAARGAGGRCPASGAGRDDGTRARAGLALRHGDSSGPGGLAKGGGLSECLAPAREEACRRKTKRGPQPRARRSHRWRSTR